MIYTYNKKNNILNNIETSNPAENDIYFIDYVGDAKKDLLSYISDRKIGQIVRQSDLSDLFCGTFLLLIYSKADKSLFITSNMFGAPVPLYFADYNNQIVITTSLDSMKKETGMPFNINIKYIPAFQMNGFLKGSDTLICGIHKLPQGTNLWARRKTVKLLPQKYNYRDEYTNILDKSERYEKVVSSSVKSNIPGFSENKSYTIALSGGYDSNSILFFLKKLYPSVHVNAVSIGGAKGRDESKIAKEIADYYTEISFDYAIVTPETFTHFDEIVERLEGNVFEIGVFLQYELAKLLKNKRYDHLICGECADQVFHKLTYEKNGRRVKKFSFENTPLEMGSYVVLKKSAYMLNSFGIKGYYPFLSHSMICMGHDYRELNGMTKEFHKKECIRLFREEISSKLVKQGGTTQMMSMFDEDFDCLKEAQKLKYYDAKYIPMEYGPGEAEKMYYSMLKYIELFEKRFCDTQ